MHYTIAGISIRLPEGVATGHFEKALAPFATADRTASGTMSSAAEVALELQAGVPVSAAEGYREIDSFDFREAEADCRFGHDAEGYLFEMIRRTDGEAMRFRKAEGSSVVMSDLRPGGDPSLVRFGLWMLFNLAAVPRGVAAVHSSVLTYRGEAVLFLGESGTGKSTHTRLWREHIEGAGLLNDDSPFVRTGGGQVVACGSPWSGKTPCYKAQELPLRAIVRLSKAPHNCIRKLSPLQAYGALQPSLPPAFVHDEALFDAMNSIASAILSVVPVYHLECLPDAAAAELCRDTLFNQ